ncbi:NAD(P)/FAD-dependent oxidoreductase [Fulvivirga sediminis]|uniref:FAD-binding oxidoreductase n=1 Tax=Fulvivirga sediminis TaxID=2803949 RepID=A0A937F8G9_9BACT|nr:FAD-dependent oxidoreductase [Fulvivirga sediminis]MBL3657091.1 FAD-binding oxidoreductase [Fulvivirga sediminis]
MSVIYDYLIVGQGLAGSALAHHLLALNKKILVIDENRENTSSKVAGGLYNPITGRKMVKTWKADTLFPFMHEFYQNIEKQLNTKFLYDTPIYRPFISMEEQNEWMGKSATPEYSLFIKKVHQGNLYDFSKDKFGGVELNYSGYLAVPKYLEAYQQHLKAQGCFLEDKFVYNDLEVGAEEVKYKDITCRKIIFCDGLGSLDGKYFSWLPFRPVKGEVIQLRANIELRHIINRGVFVVKKDDNYFEVGSNYDNKNMDLEPTEKAREEILGKMSDITDFSYKITDQRAGIRPATADRRPIIGMHPEYKTIGIFNGLGTKGVSLAPFFAHQYVEYLEADKELMNEVNINRYFSLY